MPSRVPLPLSVSAPLLIESPRATVPESASAFAKLIGVAEALEMRPPLAVRIPVPNAWLEPSWMAPAIRFTPPLNVFAEDNVNTAAPFFTN